jgi:enoyl-CoA hydratase
MGAGYVTIEASGDVACVRVDRPPANALDLELLEQGRAALDELAASQPAAVVLTGREGFFSAGVDLKLAPTLDAAGQRRMVEGINRLFAGWYAFPRPLVCAVNGHAIAGGLILALCGDHRVGARGSSYGLTELRAGIPYPAVAMAVVRAELTPPAARRLVLGAGLVDAETAAALGVFDELADPGDVLERSLEAARGLAALPRTAYERIKGQLRGDAIAAIETAIASGADPLLGGWLAGETAAAAAAVLGGSG